MHLEDELVTNTWDYAFALALELHDRLAWILYGWSTRSALMLLDAQVEAEIDMLFRDCDLFGHLCRDMPVKCNDLVERNQFQTVPVQQIVQMYEENERKRVQECYDFLVQNIEESSRNNWVKMDFTMHVKWKQIVRTDRRSLT